MNITSIILIVAFFVLLWLGNRPRKTDHGDGIFISDIGALPDGLYTLLIEELSPRMAIYIRTMPLGQFDQAYFLHHSQLPKSDGDKEFRESILIEKGKIVA